MVLNISPHKWFAPQEDTRTRIPILLLMVFYNFKNMVIEMKINFVVSATTIKCNRKQIPPLGRRIAKDLP